MNRRDYDCIVVGSGPNGMAAAIKLQQEGLSVLLIEGKNEIGGGMRSAQLTLPGFIHDVCSAIHPLAIASPYFSTLPLHKYGLEFIHPPICAAHPFDDWTAAALYMSIEETASALDKDGVVYKKIFQPLAQSWPKLKTDILAPLHFPKHPAEMIAFGWKGLSSATQFSKRFQSIKTKGLWGGMAAHSMLRLSTSATSAIGLVLMMAAHVNGWPIPKRGSQSIADALAAHFVSLGGKIETNFYVRSLDQLPLSRAILFDVGPRQLLEIAGHKFSSIYKSQLSRFRYGMGVFKIDWALDAPIPFLAEECKMAGTVHLGNSLEEMVASENLVAEGKHPERPFVLLAQQSLFDSTRAPEGRHTAWAYCHVPNASRVDMTQAIEKQVERFAPGFRERVLAKHVMNAQQMEEYNPNYVGGDINGGMSNLQQLFTRPALRWSPYKTSAKGLYICSSSTPPGGGVHGMCGFFAAQQVRKDLFRNHI
jgi:phytoene dehydrogenase-like protein